MTDSYNQTSINLGPASSSESINVVSIPLINMAGAGPTGPVYFIQLGPPADLYGSAASEWLVTPGVPGVTSAKLKSATRQAPFWTLSSFLQQGPSAGAPRAFLSAFYDGTGVAGGAVSFTGNNWRQEISISWGGLLFNQELSFRFSWNGNAPLTLNPGSNLILIST